MLLTAVILAPSIMAMPAIQDLANLRTVINAAVGTISDPNNPFKGWVMNIGAGKEHLGTADLVNNITNTVLGLKYQVDTNKTAWLQPDTPNLTNGAASPPGTPTLPLTSSIVLPSTAPTAVMNTTIDLSAAYIDYISTIPSLSTGLMTLGRAYHREMNTAVREAIAGLQQALSTLQSSMLQDNLINSQAVLRTLRASSSLENAQVAWGRFLNLPGRVGGGSSDAGSSPEGSMKSRRDMTIAADHHVIAGAGTKSPIRPGSFYSHDQLWGRHGQEPDTVKEGIASKTPRAFVV